MLEKVYRYESPEQGERAVGKGKATHNSVMTCGALTDEQKSKFSEWAEKANPGDKHQADDIEFTLLYKRIITNDLR